MIEIAGLSKQYAVATGSVAALHDVTLKVETGERLGLFGPSGSGKSTLLRCIAGLEAPEKGLIRIAGVEVYNAEAGINVAPWIRPIGVVFQDYALWPHLRVLENVIFPLRYGRAKAQGKSQQRELALEILQKMRLDGLGERFPSELSGGQRQRVALARALICRPSVLLMDEPLSSLDPHLRRQTRNELVEILERADITTIFVSHDHVDGLFMTNAVGIMREGRLVQLGSPLDVFLQPVDPSVAETLDVGAMFRCEQIGGDGRGDRLLLKEADQSLRLPGNGVNGKRNAPHLLLIPTNACSLWKGSSNDVQCQKLTGQVVRAGYTGRGWCVLVSVGGISLEIWERERPAVKHGDQVEIAVDVERVRIFP